MRQPQAPRHRVFISFHHDDQQYKDKLVQLMKDNIVDESVELGDIDDRNTSIETIRQRIRDNFIRDATVTIVLIVPCTWQRKHVDWEIGSSLRKTRRNPRCGLLGILLPNHPDYRKERCNLSLMPPRLAVNCKGTNPYASIYRWSNHPTDIRRWIDDAFKKCDKILPNNNTQQFRRNRTGDCARGWQN